jgi:hypothetical protein
MGRGLPIAIAALATIFFGCGGGGSNDDMGTGDMTPDLPDMGAGCSPFEPSTCEEGQRCATLFARDAGSGSLVGIFFACVSATNARGREAPCNGISVGTSNAALRVTTDNCAEGLLCTVDEQDIPRCKDMCDGSAGSCHEGSFCVLGTLSPEFGTCSESDDCDVVFQTGCGDPEACYTAPATNGDLLSSCELPDPAPGTMAGTACATVSDCPSGMDCLGPDGTLEGALACRVFCDPTAGPSDEPPAGCAAGTCFAIPVAGTVQIPTAPGICR